MNKDIELLAPAGTYDAFLAAIENGADAIYLGGKLFNARANASNFSLEELEEMVKFAHLRNVKIYVTLNTLLNNTELAEALDFAYDLYNINIDAVIVQDFGLAKVLHEYIPGLELHASTQMTVYNLAGVKELQKVGFKRVVLARELSFEEIKNICDNTDVEIEIFIHGALCISYSGQCLMSSMIGDRSGNRGKCAQPCRLPYTLLKNDAEVAKGYLLSPKDLSMLDLISSIPNVKSLKIEGRMKSPEYVATTVKTYRKYIDKYLNHEDFSINETDRKNIVQIFNRGGFTSAYLKKKQGSDMMCYEKPKNWGIYIGKVTSYDGKRYIEVSNKSELNIGDGIEIWNNENTPPSTIISEIEGNKIGRIHGNIHVGDKVYKTSDKNLMKIARESFSRNFIKKSNINMSVTIKKDEPICFEINGMHYNSDTIPDMAQNKPITKEKVIEQLSKTGDTPFKIENLDLTLDENLFLPISTLNDLRRNALKSYEEFILNNVHDKVIKKPLEANFKRSSKQINNVTLCIRNLSEDYSNLKNVDTIYVPFREVLKNKEKFEKVPFKKYIMLPTITKNNYDILIKKHVLEFSKICDGFVLSNIGQLEYFNGIDTDLIANYTFNIFNNYSIDYLSKLGFSKITLSPELTKEQINSLSYAIPSELMVYGAQRVMTSEHCPVGNLIGKFSGSNACSKPCTKNDKFYLKDRLGMKFEVLPDNIDCESAIYNSKITSIESKDLKINSIRIDVTDEPLNEVQKIINTHKSGQKMSGEKYTNGHIARSV